MSEAQHLVLAGVLQTPTRTSEVVDLNPEYFDEVRQRLFVFVVGYYKKLKHKNALDLSLARSRLERSKNKKLAGELLELVYEYESYSEVTDAEFRDALVELARERRQDLIRDHASEAIDAIVEGDYRIAEEAFRLGLTAIEDAELENEPPIDIRSPVSIDQARRDIEADPEERAEVQSFRVGFSFLTKRVSFRRKELTILGGYSADGKTQIGKTLAYNAHMKDHARVLWVSLEMSKEEMRTLIIAAHAATLDPRGVDYRAILEKRPNKIDRALWLRALDDFQVDEHEDTAEIESQQGRIEIWSPSREITWSRYADRARSVKRDRGLDILAGDYLELILPDRSRGSYRLDIKDMIQSSKYLARELDLWHLMLHQISRKGRGEAEKRNPPHYRMRDLGESSGVEKAGDTVIWSYYDDDLRQDKNVRVGIAKARKGEILLHGRHCYANFARAIVGEIADEDL